MALNSGFDRIDPAADSFSDWLNKTNELIDLMRGDTPSGGIIHANNSIANTDGDARLHGAFIANTFHVVNCIYGGDIYANGVFNETDLTICTNAVFEGDLSTSGDTSLNHLSVTGNTSLNNLSVTGDATMTSLSIDDLEVINLTVTGNANIESIDGLLPSSNGIAITGNESSVNTSTKQVLETFDKSESKGFKYIIHAQNDNSDSVYTVEIMCGHNDTDLFYTRYGELVNNFNATLEPKITGNAIELEVTCPDASSSNVHTFNIVRIETNIQPLEFAFPTANGVAVTGEEGSVNSSTKQVLETFSKFDTKGFKYIIHGHNDDTSSVYTVEMMCGHNGSNLYYTRYGEISNNFDVNLEPKITGNAIELEVTCPNASTSNVHTFNIVRIETR